MSIHWKGLSAALLSAGLLSLGWPPLQLPFLLFFGLIPLLWFEDYTRQHRPGLYFPYLYLGLFLWNLATTWWVWFASPGGAIAMLLANSLLMCLPFLLYRSARNILSTDRALVAFVLYWLGFEYLHHTWELAYPWLSLGNGFATAPRLVQFYEYTGVSGGSLWILLVNVLLFRLTFSGERIRIALPVAALLLPLILSLILLPAPEPEAEESTRIVVVQPNIDPYKKFDRGGELGQVRKFIELARTRLDDKTELLVFPETAIVEFMDEDQMQHSASVGMLMDLIREYPDLSIVTGASTYRFFPDESNRSATARQTSEGYWYDSYNTALLINSGGIAETYHKSKLVPGVERMPYPRIFGFLEYFAIDMGGITGSLGMDGEAKSFNQRNTANVAPLICYESVFGDYARQFVQKGAQLVFVITNDGWWRDTPGYKQHMHYARLRAIETRREVIRSANTGISCHINKRGEILHRTKWWEADAFTADAHPSDIQTFFTRNGDGIGKTASFLAVFLILSVWVRSRVLKNETS